MALGIGVIAAFIALCTLGFRWEGLWQRSIIVGVLAGILGWAVITFAWWLFRCRIVRLLLVATFLGSVTILASGYRYVHYLPMIAFVLASAIMAVVKPGEVSFFKTMLRLSSRKPNVAAIRNKCLRLTAPFIVVYWVAFIALTPLVAKSINLEFKEFKPVDRRVVLLEPNEAYQQLMSTFEAEGLSKTYIYHLLGIVMPEDLPALLQKLKNKEFADYRWRLPLRHRKETSEQEMTRLEKKKQQQRRLNDGDLVLVMRGCGRVLKAYLDKTHSWQPPEEKTHYGLIRHRREIVLYPLRKPVMFYGDRQIAEEIFKIMLCAVNGEDDFEAIDISPYLNVKSAALLKKGLAGSNKDMRAWCVWQLRKIGYKWSIEELAKLLTDESWKVRANVVAVGGKEITALAAKDHNSFVRAAASLWAGN